MKIINSLQEISSPMVNAQLQRIIEILSSKDLFITTVDALKTDKMSSNLIDGLLSVIYEFGDSLSNILLLII